MTDQPTTTIEMDVKQAEDNATDIKELTTQTETWMGNGADIGSPIRITNQLSLEIMSKDSKENLKTDETQIGNYFKNLIGKANSLNNMREHYEQGKDLTNKIDINNCAQKIQLIENFITTRIQLGDRLDKDSHRLEFEETVLNHSRSEKLSQLRNLMQEDLKLQRHQGEERALLKQQLKLKEEEILKTKQKITSGENEIKELQSEPPELLKLKSARKQNQNDVISNRNSIELLVNIKQQSIELVKRLQKCVDDLTMQWYDKQTSHYKESLKNYNDAISVAVSAADDVKKYVNEKCSAKQKSKPNYNYDYLENKIREQDCDVWALRYVLAVGCIVDGKKNLPAVEETIFSEVTLPPSVEEISQEIINRIITFSEPLTDSLPPC